MIYLFSTIIISLANLYLGLITYLKNPKSHTSKLMLLLSIIVSLWAITNYFSIVLTEPDDILFWIRMVMATTSWVGPTLFLLANTFPANKTKLPSWAVYVLLALAFLTSVLAALPFVFTSLVMTESGPQPQAGPAVPLYAFGMVGLSAASFVILIRKIFTTTGIERTRNTIFLVGLITSFSLMIGTTFVAVVAFNTTSLVPTGPLWSVILLMALSYAIIKHRFLDIRLVLAKSVAYLILIILLAAAYSLLLFIIQAAILGIPLDRLSLFISVATALTIALTFQPLLRVVENVTDKIFYKGRYEETDLLNTLTKKIASTVVLKDLTNRFMQEITKQMKIQDMHITLLEEYRNFSLKSKNFLLSKKDLKILIKAAHATDDSILVFDELTESTEKDIMRSHDISVFLPLLLEGHAIGSISFGPKASGEMYTEQDIRVFQILAPEFAVAVRNALSYEEITTFNIRLKEEVEKATSKLKAANIRLKELDKQKDEFVSVASHELRTPMTAIRGYLWLALNKSGDKIDPTIKHHLEVSYDSTIRLINLVNDMLTISRLERKTIEIKKEPIDIIPIVRAVYDELKIQADEKHVAFEIIHDDKPYEIDGDKDKLRDVFQNLVGNALKFTLEGHVKITCSRTDTQIKVAVEDTGPGIRKEDRDKLFGKFAKLDHAYKNISNVQGTGLGLYITKKIVSLHGGDITVQSEVDQGTTFTVTLPAR